MLHELVASGRIRPTGVVQLRVLPFILRAGRESASARDTRPCDCQVGLIACELRPRHNCVGLIACQVKPFGCQFTVFACTSCLIGGAGDVVVWTWLR